MGCTNTKDDSQNAGHDMNKSCLCSSCFSRPVICKACSCSVSVFKRKKCNDCEEIHCSKCLNSESSRQSGEKVCSKCLILSSGQFTAQDLMAYSVRELRQFLFRKEIAMNNCKEKADLIELAMQMSCSLEYLSDLDEHSRHVQLLRERMQTEQFTYEQAIPADSVNDLSSASGFQETPTVALKPVPPEKNQTFPAEKHIELSSEYMFSEVAFSLPGQMADRPATECTEGNDLHLETNNLRSSETDEKITDSCETEHVQEVTAVEELCENVDGSSLSNPNEIPVMNGLNTEDVVSAKVTSGPQKTVLDVHAKRKEGSKVSNHLCLICSVASKDCVFLECGHMLTCYCCGERLIECPMCHSYISRTVRAFRA